MSRKSSKSLAQQLDRYITPFRYDGSGKFHLKAHKPTAKGGLDKESAQEILDANKKRLNDFQEKLYAQDRWSLLIVFQAMDAAGKDSAIKAIFEGINPQGCDVHAFKAPSSKELDHDFLWRHMIALPERGRIGIFNRSYYEEVLVTKVHPAIIESQKLPPDLKDRKIFQRRYREINNFEDYLHNNGIHVLKFFLNVSRDEQKKRFLERIDRPEKNWKFSAADAKERGHWDEYMDAYEECLRATSTKKAPWYVIPADNKWVTRLAVSRIIYQTLKGLKLHYPTVTEPQKQALGEAKRLLESEK